MFHCSIELSLALKNYLFLFPGDESDNFLSILLTLECFGHLQVEGFWWNYHSVIVGTDFLHILKDNRPEKAFYYTCSDRCCKWCCCYYRDRHVALHDILLLW